MKIAIVSICSERRRGLEKLLESTTKFGYENHEVVIAPTVFGNQMPILYKWCKENVHKYSHMIYSDAWDTFFVTGMEEFLNKLPKDKKFFCSGEKVCFPNPALSPRFPESKYAWRFICGGNFFVDISFFIELFEKTSSVGINDQEWLSLMFLDNQEDFAIDYNCDIFQPLAFAGVDELKYERHRLLNTTTGSYPVILHGNAGTNMEKAYHLLTDVQIPMKQVNGEYIDLAVSKEFVDHYNDPKTFAAFIVHNEINQGLWDWKGNLKDDSIIIDAGANVGLWALFMLPKAKFIYCIEPTESHATVLSALLKCFTNNFSVDKLALYNKDGVCNFSVSPGNSTENKISNKGINVPCSTLDTYLKKHNLTKVSILKLDIEGAEGEVIQSVGSEIGICDTVYVEVHNIDEKKMIEKMSSVNFSNTTGNRGLSYYFYNNAE